MKHLGRRIEAYLCPECGSMEWNAFADGYVASFRVRSDGRVEYSEDFYKFEVECSKCGCSLLINIEGARRMLRELARLKPEDRILRALEMGVEGEIRINEDPKNLLELIEESQRDRGEEFLSKVRSLIGRLRILE